MRGHFVAFIAVAACGPMYQSPQQPPPPQQQQVSGPPGGGDPGDPYGAQQPTYVQGPTNQGAYAPPTAPSDPYAGGYADPVAEARPAPPPKAPPPPPPKGNLPADAQAFVDSHNKLRAKHCAGALTWSAKLAQFAQQWANTLRDKNCMFGHSGNQQYGENLAAGTIGAMDPTSVVQYWYDEIKDYSFKNGGFSMQTGHFTQVVWRGTTQVGCGHSQCKGMDIWVCEYDPAGNWEGQYKQNVLPPGCR
jgi:uncharacterized protein YkwD